MLIDNITSYCNDRYINRQKCDDCSYGSNCPGDCGICLEHIHFPNTAPAPRKYDCPNMANFYTCKYSYKYMSEIAYALAQLKDLKNKEQLKVMSIGCGPSTDLFALDYLKEKGLYKFDTLKFRGIDFAKEVWIHIHKQIKKYNENLYKANFYYEDITELIDTIVKVKWVPDLIVFQYVFSDMEKHCPHDNLKSFISKIASFINNDMDPNTYILLNDINLNVANGGGREHFDELLSQIQGSDFRKYHFNNSNRSSHFHYGEEYNSNSLVQSNPEYLSAYNPFDSCASAQLIIKKVIE